MIELPDDYILEADRREFTLRKRKFNKESGEAYISDKEVAHYPTLATLIRGLSDRRLYDAVQRMTELWEIQEDLIHWATKLQGPLTVDVRKAVKAYVPPPPPTSTPALPATPEDASEPDPE